MLYIIAPGHNREWHVGEPIPSEVNERVVKFQADGDELVLITDAMAASRGELLNGIVWVKGPGFQREAIAPKKIYRIWYKTGPKFGSVPQIGPTGQTFKVQAQAELWIKMNPAHDGEWSIKEENT